MKLYDKRIAFLISDQHFIPHGGIGSFVKVLQRCVVVLVGKLILF
jgi:hypothetical protein